MDTDRIEEEIGKVLRDSGNRDYPFGEYHPSQVSGCPLKVFLNMMTDHSPTLNRWLFQGAAVHHYLEQPHMMQQALHNAGYHFLSTDFEVETHYQIDSDIWISGTCDILCHGNGDRTVFDIKYSSIPPYSGHGRIYMYMSQANTYAHMFKADKFGLIMINSKSDNIPEDINVISTDLSEENWELVKNKARMIHSAAKHYDYHRGERWEKSELAEEINEFWENVMDHIDKQHCPSYEKECQYCPHSEYCPVKQGKLGGLRGLVDKAKS